MRYFVWKKNRDKVEGYNVPEQAYLAYLTGLPDLRGKSDKRIKNIVKMELKRQPNPKLDPKKYDLDKKEQVRIQPNFQKHGMGKVIHDDTWIEIKIPKRFRKQWKQMKKEAREGVTL